MTNWKRVRELDRKEFRNFKIVIVLTLLSIILVLVSLTYFKDEYGYDALIIFIIGYVSSKIFNNYDKEYTKIATKLDKLK